MMIKTAQRIQHIEEYYFSRKLQEIARLRADGADILNLGIGSPDQAPDPSVINELHTQSQHPSHHRYQSYRGVDVLRHSFSDWYSRHFEVDLDPKQEILPLIGSKEGIMHLSMTFLEAGDQVLIPNPGYPAYRATALLSGAEPMVYELSETNGWLPDLAELSSRDLSKVKMMWINYPHMPTGSSATSNAFQQLVDFARTHRILLVNDNPYSFILNDRPLSLLSVPGAKDVAIELNSLSKSHNMAGWRLGMMAGRADYLQAVMKFKSNMDSGMFLPLQLAAAKALSLPNSWYDGLNNVYRRRRELVYQMMDLLDCRYDTQAGGLFVWARIPEQVDDAYELSDQLLYDAQVFMTPGGIFGSAGNRYIRTSLCSSEETLTTAIERITKWRQHQPALIKNGRLQ